jgi:hypothetical protein
MRPPPRPLGANASAWRRGDPTYARPAVVHASDQQGAHGRSEHEFLIWAWPWDLELWSRRAKSTLLTPIAHSRHLQGWYTCQQVPGWTSGSQVNRRCAARRRDLVHNGFGFEHDVASLHAVLVQTSDDGLDRSCRSLAWIPPFQFARGDSNSPELLSISATTICIQSSFARLAPTRRPGSPQQRIDDPHVVIASTDAPPPCRPPVSGLGATGLACG